MDEEKYEEQGISLSDLFFLIKKNLILILIITGFCTIVGAAYGFLLKPITYTATMYCVIDAAPTNTTPGSSTSEVSYYSYSVNLTNTFQKLFLIDSVVKDTKQKLQDKYPELTAASIKGSVTITTSTAANLIEINVATNDSQKSIDIANTITDSTIDCANNSQTVSLKDKLQIVGARPTDTVAKRGATIVCVVSFVIGLVISFGIVLIKYLTDNTYTSRDAFEKAYRISVLACLQDAEVGGNQ